MNKKMTQMIKGLAILTMLTHHFIIFPINGTEYSNAINLLGGFCKICVALYALLSGYGYFFAKEKTIKYGLKKIWGLLKIYWLSLFTIFIPAAILGGVKLTAKFLLIQLFGLLPNLNWFAWYVFFYIFCMLVIPFVHKLLKNSLFLNSAFAICVPFGLCMIIYLIPNYQNNTLLNDLFSCFLYFPVFLIGYLMAKHKVIEKIKEIRILNNIWLNVFVVVAVIPLRIFTTSIIPIQIDFVYAPLLIIAFCTIFNYMNEYLKKIFFVFGKYSTEMWFFHAVFFSSYVSNLFLPVLKLVPWTPLMYIWLVLLSLVGAFIYAKLQVGIEFLFKKINFKRNVKNGICNNSRI